MSEFRERVAEAVEAGAVAIDVAKYFLPGDMDRFVDALLAAGPFPEQATADDEWPAWIDPEDGFNYSNGLMTGFVRDASWRPEGCVCLSRNCPIHGGAR